MKRPSSSTRAPIGAQPIPDLRKKRTRRPAPPIPDIPGKKCPNCGEEYVQPVAGNYAFYPSWEEKPHENPFDCIRHLAKRLRDAESEAQDLRCEVNNLRDDIRAVERGPLGEGLS